MSNRPCSRVACTRKAEYTLTFDYEDKLAVIGPLALAAEPHSYDLCARHAERSTPPQGWSMMRPVVLGS
ncbi:DUF3499 domain-containing protein [Pseudoclavibacter sp. RFBJ3]|uniref:DUF3499 family protein n=1 Tax=unclassified Pseudoclavibacter TaxID=2615177 RepID=UPI000CE91136|nr:MULTISPECIES: DUF3499 family protein [unclassified Pseudoclavibacter]MBF4552362.1 DUF3499 family protein [Pseudoclavibacter sp. VKM Ac-2888]PPF36480.1 DUF3499 domain-containing protein [Pseudoclavibacter sp. AY1H1]PPF74444.1 DUF3499 domain-containing protein [Pseudoclavibacter sp. Z016]PPF82476.1 DUF3499 domain-containing protein [Pseudoclavibacter sp. RFBJ5]PPF91369.1 DUF3499 domain-containing protein [Pseudoclavibacter sp. RFBJ3]